MSAVAVTEPRTFLDVTRSVTGRGWRSRLADDRGALALAQRLEVPEIIGRVLAARGVDLDGGEDFLNPSLRASLPNPSDFRDMDRAAERLKRAITKAEPTVVFGDYDVDGATSSALLKRFFEATGGRLEIYIPDRLSEGYGPNTPALLRLKEAGARLVITTDCGISAHQPLAAAADAGLDVVVVDHHLAEPRLPPACAVVNPNRLDESGAHGQLAAVGVTYLLVIAVNRALRAAGWYGAGRPEPDLLQWLDLVALGTVCDIVPLTGLNRPLVTQGLKVMARRSNIGLAALAEVAGLSERPGAYHLGFVLGPRINAGGRVGRSDLGARLLTTRDTDEAVALAHQLNDLNVERRAIERAVEHAVLAHLAHREAEPGPLVFATGEGWHPGVIGIVAIRLVDRYRRPAFVVALDGGVGKGSGRSVAGVDIGAAVTAARQAGLLINGGGHPMAAGLTVAAERLDELEHFLGQRISPQAAEAVGANSLGLDGALSVAGATPELLETLARAGPFGAGNPEPRFAVPAARVVRADVVGENHVRCILADSGGGRLKAIAFRSLDGELGPALLNAGGAHLHIAGRLRANNWRGERGVEMHIDDIAHPRTSA